MNCRFTTSYSNIHTQVTRFHDYNRALNDDNVNYQLKKTHTETLRLLLILYCKQVEKFFDQQALDRYYDRNRELPPFKTYACSVQKACKMRSKSTFYDHRRRFLNTGLLHKVDYEAGTACQLWYFNPVLFANVDAESYVKKYVSEHFSARKTLEAQQPNFDVYALLSMVSVPIQAWNMPRANIISHVDSVDSESSHQSDMRNASHVVEAREPAGSIAGNTGKPGDFLPDDLKKSEDFAEKNFRAEKGQKVRAKKVKRQKIPAFVLKMVVEFWLYAKAKLYEDLPISESEERMVKNMLYQQYFSQWPKYPAEKQWKNYLQNLKKQVDISAREIAKKGYKMPSASYYFSRPQPELGPEFKFYKTEEMLARNVYDQVHLELRKWKRGKGRCKQMTATELMKRHFGMLREVSNRKYLDHFTQNMVNRYVRKY